MKNIVLIAALFITALTLNAQQKKKIQVLLITGVGITGPDHMYSTWSHAHYNHILQKALESIADVTITDDLSVLNETNLSRFDVIMNNSLFKEPTSKQFEAFYKFIEDGKAYFSIHAGLVSFLNSPKYIEMMGGRFINHDDIKTFTVQTHDAWYGWETEGQRKKHPVAEGIDDFKTLDELYLAQFNTDKLEVIARAEFHPVMWTRNWGKGKVMCLTLGHGPFSQENTGFQKLLYNGVAWLAANQQRQSR